MVSERPLHHSHEPATHVHLLAQTNWVLIFYFSEIHFNIMLPTMLNLTTSSFPSCFPVIFLHEFLSLIWYRDELRAGKSEIDSWKLFTVKTNLDAHPASYSAGTGAASPGVKRLERQSDYSPPASVYVKNDSVISLIPIRLLKCCLIN
jgi:hypothetical protein